MSESPRSGSSASFLSDGLEGSSDMDDVSEYNCYQEDPNGGQPCNLLDPGTALDSIYRRWTIPWVSGRNCAGPCNLFCLIPYDSPASLWRKMEIQNILDRGEKMLPKYSAIPLRFNINMVTKQTRPVKCLEGRKHPPVSDNVLSAGHLEFLSLQVSPHVLETSHHLNFFSTLLKISKHLPDFGP